MSPKHQFFTWHKIQDLLTQKDENFEMDLLGRTSLPII
jgi:hypothetical protein